MIGFVREVDIALPLIPGIHTRVGLWLGLAQSCNNKSDRLIPGESTCTYSMIPADAKMYDLPTCRWQQSSTLSYVANMYTGAKTIPSIDKMSRSTTKPTQLPVHPARPRLARTSTQSLCAQ